MSTNYILSIETSTTVCSVSLANNGVEIQSISSFEPNMHATALTVFIQELMTAAKISYTDLSAVSVSMGPGSYTGLRIGVSTAKGLCFATDIALLGVNSLDALLAGYIELFGASNQKQLLCPMIDARRQEVYCAFYDGNGVTLQATQALIVDESSFQSYIDQGYQIKLFGSGADKFQTLFQDEPAIQIIADFKAEAKFQNLLAFQRYEAQKFEDLAYFEPFYLKDFVVTQSKKNLLS